MIDDAGDWSPSESIKHSFPVGVTFDFPLNLKDRRPAEPGSGSDQSGAAARMGEKYTGSDFISLDPLSAVSSFDFSSTVGESSAMMLFRSKPSMNLFFDDLGFDDDIDDFDFESGAAAASGVFGADTGVREFRLLDLPVLLLLTT